MTGPPPRLLLLRALLLLLWLPRSSTAAPGLLHGLLSDGRVVSHEVLACLRARLRALLAAAASLDVDCNAILAAAWSSLLSLESAKGGDAAPATGVLCDYPTSYGSADGGARSHEVLAGSRALLRALLAAAASLDVGRERSAGGGGVVYAAVARERKERG